MTYERKQTLMEIAAEVVYIIALILLVMFGLQII
jgi:hypothetical protein